jgi:hypothetical protein
MPTTNEYILAGALVAVIIIAGVALYMSRIIQNIGTIKTIGFDIYSDAALTTQLTQINWGMLSPGDLAAVTAYAKNNGNIPILLTYNTSNWNPAYAVNYLTPSWNYTGTILQPLQSLTLQFTLAVKTTIVNVTNFSYNFNAWAVNATS